MINMKLRHIILSYDFFAAVIFSGLSLHFLPSNLKLDFCSSIYSMGITVLSIIFSLFFAALTVVMTSSDNKFVEFMEEDGSFTDLISTFKYTLGLLFTALIYSIILYMYSDYSVKNGIETQHKAFFLMFQFLFSYSLISTVLSAKDSIIFSQFRIRFLSNNIS